MESFWRDHHSSHCLPLQPTVVIVDKGGQRANDWKKKKKSKQSTYFLVTKRGVGVLEPLERWISYTMMWFSLYFHCLFSLRLTPFVAKVSKHVICNEKPYYHGFPKLNVKIISSNELYNFEGVALEILLNKNLCIYNNYYIIFFIMTKFSVKEKFYWKKRKNKSEFKCDFKTLILLSQLFIKVKNWVKTI